MSKNHFNRPTSSRQMNLKPNFTNTRNYLLSGLSSLRYVVNCPPNIHQLNALREKYSTVIQKELFTGNDLNLSLWRAAPLWGNDAAVNSYYGGTEFVAVNSDGLNLYAKFKPESIITSTGNRIIPYGTGYVESIFSFLYGYVEIQATFPSGDNLWPALWMTGSDEWPPEIDIAEAWSMPTGNYPSKLWDKISGCRVKPALHYGVDKTVSLAHTPSISNPLRKFTSSIITYSCEWDMDGIKIYYNGHLVYMVTDKSILQWFNKPMRIILSNGIDTGKTDHNTSVFVISKVTVSSASIK